MRDVIKIAKKAGRFDPPLEFDEISLRSGNRNLTRPWDLSERLDRPYEPPSSVIRRVTAELHYLREREETLQVLGQIREIYGNKKA
jgi:hypothetical protein